jgi:hypothetical protein
VLKTQTFSWVQLLLASIYSGAFHPTAEGQAAIADAVVEQARGVLAKYEGRRRAPRTRRCRSCSRPTTDRACTVTGWPAGVLGLHARLTQPWVRCTTRESVLSDDHPMIASDV